MTYPVRAASAIRSRWLPPLVAAVCTLVAGVAAAQTAEATGPPEEATPAEAEDDGLGTYLAAGFVWGHEQFNDVGTRDVDDSPGFSAWVGQRLAPWAGVEVQWEYIDDFEVKNLGAYGSNGHVQVNHLTLNARLNPLAGGKGELARRVQPFVKLGAGFGYLEIEDTYGKLTDDATFTLRGGAGIDWMLTPRFAIVTATDYVYPTTRINGITTSYVSATLAFQYRYGGGTGR